MTKPAGRGEVLNPSFLTKLARFTGKAVSSDDTDKNTIAIGNDFSESPFFSEARRHGLTCQAWSLINNRKAHLDWKQRYSSLPSPAFHVMLSNDVLAELKECGEGWVGEGDDPALWSFFLPNHVSAADATLKYLAGNPKLVGRRTLCVLDFIAVDGSMNRANETAEQAHFRRLIANPEALVAALYQRLLGRLGKLMSTWSVTDTLPEVSRSQALETFTCSKGLPIS
jgi:hypothetical protein